MNSKTSVVVLSEKANLYMVVDELGRTMGTGTKEVCEVLANLTIEPTKPPSRETVQTVLHNPRDNIRSAIKI
jgi:hypothetical protein